VFILGIFSMAVSNLGLSHLIQVSIPVLTAIYPPCIVLVVLSFTRPWWNNSSRIIAPAMFISLIFGILDGLKHQHSLKCCQPGHSVCRCPSRVWPG
jgi:LIVCS family branched-chain amino acid:cation transporter